MRKSDKPDRDALSTQDPFDHALTTLLKLAQRGKAAECETWKGFLPAIARGEKLSSEDSYDALMWHLAFCTHCRAEVARRQEVVARRRTFWEWLVEAVQRCGAQTAAARGATATQMLDAILFDARGNQTDRCVPVEILEPPLIDSGGGFHLILKVPAEFHDATLTIFLSDGEERRVLEGITVTVDEEGYVIVAGEDFGGRIEIPSEMLELHIQPEE